ncbi:hypothetical protein PV458_46060 [Streptomyces sp. MN03-5084-2B]|nr:hypothetical protein [Streptomyces sp. MN03-5084-2B]
MKASLTAEAKVLAEAATGRNSFAAGTPVLMADGSSKPIEQVEVGDRVENAEPGSGVVERHVVSALHVTDDDRDFVDVGVLTPGALLIPQASFAAFSVDYRDPALAESIVRHISAGVPAVVDTNFGEVVSGGEFVARVDLGDPAWEWWHWQGDPRLRP